MQSILVLIDGTICDTRQRHHLIGTPEFYQPDAILNDLAVPGSVQCLQELAQNYAIVYLGARPAATLAITDAWLGQTGFPKGPIYLAETQIERLALVRELRIDLDFIAGIGDRWDDNELHAEIGCLSLILKEFEGQWDTVARRIRLFHHQQKIRENEIHLRGKVEGLARVCPLLVSRFGESLWQAYFEGVLAMAERTREDRRLEELESFARYGLDPADLSDAARWDAILREEDWENNPVYELQEFELVESGPRRYVHKVTRCLYAELWKAHGHPEMGYQIHCRPDQAWWDRPAFNPAVRFQQPKTLMQGNEFCLFVQYLPDDD
jgi:hypothetical protein